MKEIQLTKGYKALVDDEDYNKLIQHKWVALVGLKTVYAISTYITKGKHTYMHRFLLDCPSNMTVDHKDKNGLNNQRYNIRLATKGQQQYNSDKPQSDNGTGYRGVRRMGNSFQARIKVDGVQLHLGTFDTAEEAAKVYNDKAKELHQEFATLSIKDK